MAEYFLDGSHIQLKLKEDSWLDGSGYEQETLTSKAEKNPQRLIGQLNQCRIIVEAN